MNRDGRFSLLALFLGGPKNAPDTSNICENTIWETFGPIGDEVNVIKALICTSWFIRS